MLLAGNNQIKEELLHEALKRALENGKATSCYSKDILEKWDKNQLQTVADVLGAEEGYTLHIIRYLFHRIRRR